MNIWRDKNTDFSVLHFVQKNSEGGRFFYLDFSYCLGLLISA